MKTYWIKYYTTEGRVSAMTIEAYSYFDAEKQLKSIVPNFQVVINWECRSHKDFNIYD